MTVPETAAASTGSPATAPTAPRAPRRDYLPILDVLRIVAALGVVGVHVLAPAATEPGAGTGLLTLDMLLITAVPLFFMMAGSLNLDPSATARGARSFWRRRAVRIIPALVVWSAFYMVVIRQMVTGTPTTRFDVAKALITGLTYTHLYFLWAIAGLYALAPLLIDALKPDERRRTWGVGIAACVWTAVVTAIPHLTDDKFTPVELGSLTFFLIYAGYFILGRAALAAPLSRRASWGALALAAACIPVLVELYDARAGSRGAVLEALAPSYVSPVVMVCAVAMFSGLIGLGRSWRVGRTAERVLRTLGNATFGVFLAHFAVLVIARSEVSWLAGTEPLPLLSLWTLCVAVSTVFALLAARIPGLRLIV